MPQTAGRHRVEVTSSLDGSRQPAYLILPPGYDPAGPARPLVVSLHTWSFDLEQRNEDLEQLVAEAGWLYLFPNFRGRNDHPEACASPLARQDVIDALDWVLAHFAADPGRVYLTGISGGGYMTLAMVTSFPERWRAASAWVPLADLRAWYDFHALDEYGEMTQACIGGDPFEQRDLLAELARRSPLHEMARARDVALDIAAGCDDGHLGEPIPVWHSLAAFNALAVAVDAPPISDSEIAQLSRHEPRLEHPLPSDELFDEEFGRQILLRRHAGHARVSIFAGAHEGIAGGAMGWFQAHP
ncbi:MAG: prolyl oligopeptidase family serine peptidase [Anaerolineales bacterium]|nr:prolyl oligopeptidase family serine peptidase [Anaerolineales bacterium]MCB0031827.1 prolyl oligopeptidase family serine peptidase [Anaerolineales bacterium]MCB8961550.1 prolyl oligopeptidase family serine peptidase [Ardenticatenales bacterium]